MDNSYDHEMSPVMKLAEKLGVHDEFMKYCDEQDVELTSDNEAEMLKKFLKEKGYTQSELKKMLEESAKMAESEDMSSESDSEESDMEDKKPGVTIAIMMGKGNGGKMPPAWS